MSKSAREVSDVSLSRSDAEEWKVVSYFENGNRDSLEIGVMFKLRFGGRVRERVDWKEHCIEDVAEEVYATLAGPLEGLDHPIRSPFLVSRTSRLRS